MGIQLLQKRGTTPNFCSMSLWPNGWMDRDASWYEVGLAAGHTVLDGDPVPPHKRGTEAPSPFLPVSIVAKRSPISATAELLLLSLPLRFVIIIVVCRRHRPEATTHDDRYPRQLSRTVRFSQVIHIQSAAGKSCVVVQEDRHSVSLDVRWCLCNSHTLGRYLRGVCT